MILQSARRTTLYFEQLKKDLKKELLNVIPPQSQASPNVTSKLDTVK